MSLAAFMAYLDNNIVNVAIPTIQRSLHLSASGLEWVVSSYLLTLAGLLLVGGRLADVYRRRRVFQLGLVVFTAASLFSGLAGSGGMLIAMRAIQGVGAALLMPATLAIIVPRSQIAGNATWPSASGPRPGRWPWPSGPRWAG
jgi:MFS family permease